MKPFEHRPEGLFSLFNDGIDGLFRPASRLFFAWGEQPVGLHLFKVIINRRQFDLSKIRKLFGDCFFEQLAMLRPESLRQAENI